ncbi:MAG TPA: hypothetical protein VK567_02680, partial [Bradyrhizobium sp.]|nr:hypothetical protein [Bradyrhizobium sp.]
MLVHKIFLRVHQLGGSTPKTRRTCVSQAKRCVNHWYDWLSENPIAGSMGREIRGIAMAYHLQRIDWMPSPPLAPDDG